MLVGVVEVVTIALEQVDQVAVVTVEILEALVLPI